MMPHMPHPLIVATQATPAMPALPGVACYAGARRLNRRKPGVSHEV